ncbi:MAG: bis-aminopropyl spermidine synthase family protein [Deltaproteobacteria bacterium]|nr:bis-aminopropyl spermidine synthase family protein [Deltaproteobacteria bacterium]
MLTYADGVHLNLELHREPSLLARIGAFGKLHVEPQHRGLLLGLLFGLDRERASDPLLRLLRRRGLIADKDSLDDPVLEQRLDEIGFHWRWQRPAGKPGALFDRLYAATRRAHARRKVFVKEFGQTPALPETVVRRALLLGPGRQRVLCVGDDDLVSIPLALLGHRVTVYDIDDLVLLPFLRRIARDWKLSIRVERRDLMEPQRGAPPRRFDALFTDPMSTRECFDLFLSRGLAWLKEGGRGHCCVHPLALETFGAVQQQMRFDIVERHHEFNHYYEEGFWENYYRSDLLVLEKSAATRPRFALGDDAHVDIFAGELNTRHHACCDIRAFDPHHFDRPHVEAAIAALRCCGLFDVVAEQSHAEAASLSWIAALRGGGYLGLTAFFDEQLVAYDLFPFQPRRDLMIREIIRREIPQSFCVLVYRVAKPARSVVSA